MVIDKWMFHKGRTTLRLPCHQVIHLKTVTLDFSFRERDKQVLQLHKARSTALTRLTNHRTSRNNTQQHPWTRPA